MLPIKDYRFYIAMMRSFLDPKSAWFKGWGEKYGSCLEPVLKRIREEGPKAARFNGCEKTVLENVQPRKIMAPLKKTLKV